jgi:hypothetical protein
MGEVLVAFGVAANIVQFIDFTAKVISTGYHTRATRYGGLAGIELIQNVNDDLRSAVEGLEQSLKLEQGEKPTQNKKELLLLAEQCREVAAELFAVLESLKMHAKSRQEVTGRGKKKEKEKWYGWQNFRATLGTVWKEDRIKTLENQVDAFRQQLVLRILVSFRYVHLSIADHPSCPFHVSGPYINILPRKR